MEAQDQSDITPVKNGSSRKRKRLGRMSEVKKKLNLSSHEMGDDCQCSLKCFDNVPAESRKAILKDFNSMASVDMQNTYLSGLIAVLPVARRRPRKAEGARQNRAAYKYRVRARIDGIVKEIDVCRKAFISIHGVSKGKIEYLVSNLLSTGHSPLDKRGKHDNRPWRLPDETREAVRTHISSFKGRGSHYGLKDSKKVYLPEELNVMKMYNMFKENYPTIKVSHGSYRQIFNTEFNISFGYPRTDTCSQCDEFSAKLKAEEIKRNECTDPNEIIKIDADIKRLKTENRLHKKKASQFYENKKQARLKAKNDSEFEAVCMDFSKNLSCPNVPTNDVYYRRQLSVYSFNIHVLSSSESVFFMYPECSGKKGSDDVCSMLRTFCYEYLDNSVKNLEIFCDGCSGQNKNYTLIRFLHNLVHIEKRFNYVKVCFPIRGHSYLETDKNLGIINQKSRAEIPDDWLDVFRHARTKPCPFTVHKANIDSFRQWTSHLSPYYKKKCPFPTRPVRQVLIERDEGSSEIQNFVKYRNTFHGAWVKIQVLTAVPTEVFRGEFSLPDYSYDGK